MHQILLFPIKDTGGAKNASGVFPIININDDQEAKIKSWPLLFYRRKRIVSM
jgi:hypothetical protein